MTYMLEKAELPFPKRNGSGVNPAYLNKACQLPTPIQLGLIQTIGISIILRIFELGEALEII